MTYLNAGDTVAVELTFSVAIANSATVQFLNETTNLGTAVTATRNSTNTAHTATYTVADGDTVPSGSLKYDVTNESNLRDSAGAALPNRDAADIADTAIDTTAPTVSGITGPSVAQSEPFDITVTFSEAVTGFDSTEDLDVSGGTVQAPGADGGNQTRYSVTVSPDRAAAPAGRTRPAAQVLPATTITSTISIQLTITG